MHDCLYAKTELPEEEILDCARKVGLDLKIFEKDRKAKATLNRIRNEKKEGISFGVIGTPGLFINGKFYVGPKNYDDLLDRLRKNGISSRDDNNHPSARSRPGGSIS